MTGIRPLEITDCVLYSRPYLHDLKNLFKGAAISASTRPGPLYDFCVGLLQKGMRPTLARLTLARKIATLHSPRVNEHERLSLAGISKLGAD